MRILLLSVCSCLLFSLNTRAAIAVIDNLGPGTQGFAASISGPVATDFFGGPFEDREVAFSFTSGVSLVAVSELIFVSNLAGSPSFNPIQATLSNGLSAPGGQNLITLGSVAPTSGSPATQMFTITPSSPVPLAPNTTYWIHLTIPTGDAIYTMNNSNAPVLASGWSLNNTWYYSPGDVWTEVSSGPQARVKLSVVPIPEPSLVWMGLLAPVIFRRRQV
jgi:hypothetical protein